MPDWQTGPRVAGPSAPVKEIVVEAPNDVPRAVPASPVARLLPVLMIVATAGMVVLFVVSGAARSPASLLFPAMMTVSAIGMMVHGGRSTTRTAEVDEGRKDYLRYLSRLRGEVAETVRLQAESLAWRHPDPDTLWTLAGTPRMWERVRSDSDFCHVRVGLGRQLSAARLSLPDVGSVDELEPVAATALRDFVRAHSTVDALPIAVALTRFSTVAFGGELSGARDLMRAMVCQLAVLHGPQSVSIGAAVNSATAQEWDWLKWLPHYRPGGATTGHTVMVVDGGDVPEFAAGEITVLTLGGHALPEGRHCLRLTVSADELAVADGIREVVARPDAMTVLHAEICARRLAPFRPAVDPATPAAGDGWTQLLGIGDPSSISPATAWRRRRPGQRLRVPIGVTADGAPVELDLKEAAEQGMGPHGLCVGATGSGKSEFLRTLTLGLIATHPPEALNLVLVDFKGGATFLGLEAVRHVSAIITNLADEAHLVARMQDALAGEMNRRQELLRAAGNFASVADYEHARCQGLTMPPLPALFIVVDEFSELLSQYPEFAEYVCCDRAAGTLAGNASVACQPTPR